MATNNCVLIVEEKVISKMNEYYKSFCKPNPPIGAVFQAKLPQGIIITAYKKSKKVLFQGPNFEQEQQKWSQTIRRTISRNSSPKNVMNHQFTPPKEIAHLSTIGSDESGTGDYFGPITAAAAYVKESQHEQVQKIGVRDSKELTDIQIIKIANELKEIVPYSVIVLHNNKYNLLQEQGYNQGKMKAILHNKVIESVRNKIKPEKAEAILIDQFCLPDVYYRYINCKPNTESCIYFSTKAENLSYAVGAASILARAAFIHHMNILSGNIGSVIPKGAGSQVDKFAAEYLRKNKISDLGNFAKLHFANTEKAVKLNKYS